jgi:hypothetical protein
LVQALQWKVAGLSFFCGLKPPLLVKWCSHASAFHVWVKCQLSHITTQTVSL